MAQDVKSLWSARLAMVGFLGANFTSAVRVRRQFKPDLIHAHWWFPGGLVGSWVSKLAHIPFITTSHGSDIRLARTTSVVKPLARRVFEQSAVVTTVSHWLADAVHEFDTHVEPVVAPMPVDTTLFTPAGDRESQRILLVGRMNAQKGVAHAIRALSVMQTPAVLDIIGSGPSIDEYRALAASLNLEERVTFHGEVPHDTLPIWYRKASVLVVPSIEEGLGLVAVEAQLCETPVVASDSGGLPDVVHHEKTGLLVPPADVPALALALDSILADPTRAAQLGQAGRLHALAHFAPESVARRYLDLYHRALERRAA
jgi:glycosyltransferase involved in cell wall biosynthesis